MNYNNVAGACLLILGLAILLATLYLGYGLYTQVMQSGANPAQQKPANITVSNSVPSIAEIMGAVVSAVAAQMPLALDTSYAIAAIILALFASIGYKISMLGIHTLALNRGRNAAK